MDERGKKHVMPPASDDSDSDYTEDLRNRGVPKDASELQMKLQRHLSTEFEKLNYRFDCVEKRLDDMVGVGVVATTSEQRKPSIAELDKKVDVLQEQVGDLKAQNKKNLFVSYATGAIKLLVIGYALQNLVPLMNETKKTVKTASECLEVTSKSVPKAVKETGDGIVGAAKETGDGIVGAAKETGDGIVGAVKRTGLGGVVSFSVFLALQLLLSAFKK